MSAALSVIDVYFDGQTALTRKSAPSLAFISTTWCHDDCAAAAYSVADLFWANTLRLCRSYEHFCACGKQLDKRFKALGATCFTDRVDVNKEDLAAIDKWLSGVTTALSSMSLKTFQQLGGESASCTLVPALLAMHFTKELSSCLDGEAIAVLLQRRSVASAAADRQRHIRLLVVLVLRCIHSAKGHGMPM